MESGIIDTIVREKGFGYIRRKGSNLYFQARDVVGQKFMHLQPGMAIEYASGKDAKGMYAYDVQIVSPQNSINENRIHPKQRSAKTQWKSKVKPGKPDHRIDKLSPSEEWVLFINETENNLTLGQSNDQHTENNFNRRLVGVVFAGGENNDPEHISITNREDVHFKEISEPQIKDRILQELLDADAGIFGIETINLPPPRGDRWAQGVMHLIDWVLRLLPISGPTTVRIKIAERFEYTNQSDWTANLDSLLLNLAQNFPQRSKDISAHIQFVSKHYTNLCYADAVTHTWDSPAQDAKSRLEQSGLLGSCLHHGTDVNLLHSWDTLKQGSNLDTVQWTKLVRNSANKDSLDIRCVLLNQVAESCRNDISLWQRYHDATQAHIDSTAVDLGELSEQVMWLQSCQPEQKQFTDILELVWLTSQLELSNHAGSVGMDSSQRIGDLSESLHEEYPTLVCQADLVRAVLATNNFSFKRASTALAKWEDADMVVLGRKHWGRVQSSLGQHAAFQDDFEMAYLFFDKAIDAFTGMSNADEANREIQQTAVYRAIAAIDDPQIDSTLMRKYVSNTVSLDLADITSMSSSVKATDKYAHHLLLRYLVPHGTDAERDAYVKQHELWDVGTGHPWQLIEFYRGLLLLNTDEDRAQQHLVNAFHLTRRNNQGPTVEFIGVAIGAVAQQLGCDIEVTHEDLASIENKIPATRFLLNAIACSQEKPLDPPESLLAIVLPFNYR